MSVIKKHTSVDDAFMERIKILPYGILRGYGVWGIDGELVRNAIDVDFTTGGNPARYGYVPWSEVWIELIMKPLDAMAAAIHERIECELMLSRGFDYNRAHARANVYESIARTTILTGRLDGINDHFTAIALAGSWLINMESIAAYSTAVQATNALQINDKQMNGFTCNAQCPCNHRTCMTLGA